MKKQERITKHNVNIKDFLFSITLEEFDNQIKIKVFKEDAFCKILLNKYGQDVNELKKDIIKVCKNWIEELTGNPYYHIISDPIFVFTWEKFLYEVNFSD